MLKTDTPLNLVSLLAIDPGLNNTGIAAFSIQIAPFKILKITAWTLKADRLVDDSGLDDEDYIERLHKRYTMGKALNKALEMFSPSLVISESPFFDRRKPGSFAVLTEVLTTLFDTVVAYNPSVQFSMMEPQLVKKSLGVAGIKGKEVVKEAVSKNEEIMTCLETPMETMDEHAIDAVAVGYSWLKLKSGYVKG